MENAKKQVLEQFKNTPLPYVAQDLTPKDTENFIPKITEAPPKQVFKDR